jgi:hypothetical protein
MRLKTGLFALLRLITIAEAAESKRGLILGSSNYEQTDLPKYLASPVLSWVYNYDPQPSPQSHPYPYGNLSFIPMLWGQNDSSTFRTTIQSGPNYTDILSFNEPDMPQDVGGSSLSVEQAVSIWKSQIQPLANSGYKLGSPAGIPILNYH